MTSPKSETPENDPMMGQAEVGLNPNYRPTPPRWHTVELIAPEGFSFAIAMDNGGTLAIATKPPGGEYPEGLDLSGHNTIQPGHKCFVVRNDGEPDTPAPFVGGHTVEASPAPDEVESLAADLDIFAASLPVPGEFSSVVRVHRSLLKRAACQLRAAQARLAEAEKVVPEVSEAAIKIIPDSARYWFAASKQDEGKTFADRFLALENAYNHVVSELYVVSVDKSSAEQDRDAARKALSSLLEMPACCNTEDEVRENIRRRGGALTALAAKPREEGKAR